MFTCESCRFFHSLGNGGYCRRYPPQLVHEIVGSIERSQTAQYFPYMEKAKWCGEWKDKP
jgi:hypothetical protein